jgi:starch synthase
LANPDIEYVNFAKRAILTADIINTVSEQYREEIMTIKFGQDLHRILKNREDRLFGIVNGIDYRAYNPSLDPGLKINYNHRKIHRKKLNKEALQKKIKLPVNIRVPLLCATSRVTFQKGFELILQILDKLLELDLQMIVLGDGDKRYIDALKKYNKKFPKKIVWLPFSGNADLETLIYAGSDIFLLPSHHEPCGINQLIAMRYGCTPVVRRVGGLHNTVENFDPEESKGTGFVFDEFDPDSFFETIKLALANYNNKKVWRNLAVRAMKKSSSWEIPAKKYVELYKKVIKMNDR